MAPNRKAVPRAPATKTKQASKATSKAQRNKKSTILSTKVGSSNSSRRVSTGKVTKKGASGPSTSNKNDARIEGTKKKVAKRKQAQGPSPMEDVEVEEEEEEEGEEEEDAENIPKLPILRPVTKRVPMSTVQKWPPLPEAAQLDILDMLKDVEKPVLNSYRSEARRMEAQEAIRGVIAKLRHKLGRTPAPPITVKDKSLKLEKIVDHNREMELILEPDLRQIAQLQVEIEREQVALEETRRQSEKLTKNANTEERLRREQARKFHPIMKHLPEEDEIEDGAGIINLIPVNLDLSTSYDINLDEEANAQSNRLQQHLLSMQKNTAPLETVTIAMKRARALVDSVLLNMGGDVYESLMEI